MKRSCVSLHVCSGLVALFTKFTLETVCNFPPVHHRLVEIGLLSATKNLLTEGTLCNLICSSMHL